MSLSERERGRRPIFNKNAREILSAHLHSESSAVLSGAPSSARESSAPVLAKLDSSANKAARSHDISYLHEKPGFLRPRIPPSLIPDDEYKYEASFLPKDASSVYMDSDGLWHTAVFPSAFPSSRQDAILLDQWIGRSLAKVSLGEFTTTDDLLMSVERLVPVLTIGLHEVVRQASHSCAERGAVLEKIWKAYVALFSKVLTEMKASLEEQRRRTHTLDAELGAVYRNLEQIRKDHPVELKTLILQLEEECQVIQGTLEQTLRLRENENQELSENLGHHLADLSLWYPNFSSYQGSSLRNALPSHGMLGARMQLPAGTAPEVAIAEDFKRMVASFPPDTRRLVGRNLAHIFAEQTSDETTLESLKEELLQKSAEVDELQQRVLELRREKEALTATRPEFPE